MFFVALASDPLAQWFQIAKTRLKISLLEVISRVFPKEVSADSHNFRFRSLRALHIKNLLNRFRNRNDQSISRVSNLIFGGFLPFGPAPLVVSH